MEYEIQTFSPEKIAVFTFWGKANTLSVKEGKNKRVFFAYHLASKETPVPDDKWTLGEYQFAKSQTKLIKKEESIAFVMDELGNKYYETTDLI